MPGGDGTGPDGKGPRTGRGLGNCPPGKDSTPVYGRGRGAGRGAGARGTGAGRGRGVRQ